ncbi:MAG: class I SAM-dependent methyltransferase [Candidatus Saganbacteria bacterium]|nr:class I SAM-dependent methyltransferase [Candidatus Saganbacteria bacterium]
MSKLKIDVKSKNVLDIGCGIGFYVDFWRSQGVSSLAGFDISSFAIQQLSQKYPNNYFEEIDITNKELKIKCQYDIVCAFDVLYHIEKEDAFEQALDNIKKLCVPNALIFITDMLSYTELGIHGYFSPRSYNKYYNLLAKRGIKVIGVYNINSIMSAPLDISNYHLRIIINFLWGIMMKSICRFNLLGVFLGPILYLVDIIMAKFLSRGLSVKLLVARNE